MLLTWPQPAGKNLAAFAPKVTDLVDDISGTSPEANIRNSTATCLDYAGVLQTIATDVHRVRGGRYDAGTWYDDDGAGNQVTPSRNLNGAKWYDTKADWTTGAWAAGSEVNNGGKWYSTVAGGTDTTTFGDGIIWAEQGDYQRDFGVLVEESRQTYNTNGFDFDLWTPQGSVTVTANAAAGPSGTITADEINFASGTTSAIADLLTIAAGETSVSCWMRAKTGTCLVRLAVWNSTDLTQLSSDITLDTVWRRYSFTCTTTATNSRVYIYNDSAGGANDLYAWGYQTELAPIASSTVVGGAIRAEEMGNLKWNDAAFPESGTAFVAFAPQFASGDIAAADLSVLSLNNAVNDFLNQGAGSTTDFEMFDGTNTATETLAAFANGDVIEFALRWLVGGNMTISYRNKSNDEAWAHGTPVSFDGAFTQGGFLQLLREAGGNNAIFRNLPILFKRVMTDDEIEAMIP